jgi:hypothetical protein
MQEIAAVLVRSLAYIVKPIIEARALRNCRRRFRWRRFRIGLWNFEWESMTAEEFDSNR